MEDLEYLLRELSKKSLALVGMDLSSLRYISVYLTTQEKRVGGKTYTYEYLVGELEKKRKHILKKVSPSPEERGQIYELIRLYRACYRLEQARLHLELLNKKLLQEVQQ